MDRRHHRDWQQDRADMCRVPHRASPVCAPAVRSTLIRTQIADPLKEVSTLYEMIDEGSNSNVSDAEYHTVRAARSYTGPPLLNTSQIRTVFIIDPKKTIRAMLLYPASVGRDFDEILRWVPCFQLTELSDLTTCPQSH